MADDESALAIARDLQAQSGERALPAVVIAEAGAGAGQRSGKLEILSRPVQGAELHNRLNSLSRLVTMQDELIRRAETTKAYGLEGPDTAALPATVGDATVLLIGGDGPDLDELRAALSQAATITHCASPFQALETLLNQPFDAVVVGPQEDAAGALNFCRDTRNNTRLYNLPVILIADAAEFENPNAPFDAFASDVIARGADADHAVERIMHLVKLGRYRASLQEVYRSARHFATSDALTGLFSHGFLHAHLAKLIADARASGKPLCIGFFAIANMALINQTHGYVTGDGALRQVGGMIGALVRSEDLPARHGGSQFCVVLPDTDRDAAEPVLHRIAGVINFTDFTVPSSEQTIGVNLRTGLAELKDDDDEKSLIRRARAGLDA
jgi:two-component system cell cycle response regulator